VEITYIGVVALGECAAFVSDLLGFHANVFVHSEVGPRVLKVALRSGSRAATFGRRSKLHVKLT